MENQVTITQSAETKLESLPTGEINISKWLTNGWDLVMNNFSQFFLLTIVYLILLIVASTTFIVSLIIVGPLTAGFFYIIFNRIQGKEIYIGDLAKGFNVFVAAVLADILISVFTSLGFLFLIIPGIVISALYMFSLPLIIEQNMDFWQAMETSRKIVSRNIVELSAFMFLLYLLLFFGILLLLVGFVVALPIVFAAIAYAYCDLVGMKNQF